MLVMVLAFIVTALVQNAIEVTSILLVPVD